MAEDGGKTALLHTESYWVQESGSAEDKKLLTRKKKTPKLPSENGYLELIRD